MMRVLVTGSRSWTDYDTIEAALGSIIAATDSRIVVVHGGARGADSLAEQAARNLGLDTEVHPPNWTLGRGAGYIRNAEMVKAGADVALAFIVDDSRGASHCAGLAKRAGIPVRRFTP